MKPKGKIKSYLDPLVQTGLIIAAVVLIYIKLFEIDHIMKGSGFDYDLDRLNTIVVILVVSLILAGYLAVGIWCAVINERFLNPKPKKADRPRVKPEPDDVHKSRKYADMTLSISCVLFTVSGYLYFTGFYILVSIICEVAAILLLIVFSLIDRTDRHMFSLF